MNDKLPSAELIRKFAHKPGEAVPIEKNGTPAAEVNGKLSSQWIDITPEMAARWLHNNFNNRPVKEDVVKAYARDMIAGIWQPTHQGIVFNDRDQLIDGQHRLMAIVKAARTVRMMVTFGLPSKIEGREMTTMDCVDRGATRSVADQLKIEHGLPNGNQVAQICSSLGYLCFGEKLRRMGVGQTLEIFREFRSAADYVIENRCKQRGLRSAGVLGGFAFVIAVKPNAMEMFSRLMTGDFQSEYPAVQKLREFLTGEQSAMLIQSLNRGVAEMTVHVLWQELTGDKHPRLESKPEEWLKAVDYFRALQRDRVDRIAAMFKLPEAEPRPGVKKVEPVAPAPAAGKSSQEKQVTVPESDSKERPRLEKIMSSVEVKTRLSRFILCGRGSDTEIDTARSLFVTLARGYGYTDEVTALAIRKTPSQASAWNIPASAMTKKFKDAFESIKAKL